MYVLISVLMYVPMCDADVRVLMCDGTMYDADVLIYTC
jgi:hypothetical protein